eukprot:TRINITY_DN6976_c0_g1_i1.p1 TRINITY_DN6976_c0_g1~~TRINITY_DN6976_c0_g1_i1.p1  ORF type:complete len:1160 (+),score=261.53 TRINITY_DN6976_c0_g1_i1:86-3481(+)
MSDSSQLMRPPTKSKSRSSRGKSGKKNVPVTSFRCFINEIRGLNLTVPTKKGFRPSPSSYFRFRFFNVKPFQTKVVKNASDPRFKLTHEFVYRTLTPKKLSTRKLIIDYKVDGKVVGFSAIDILALATGPPARELEIFSASDPSISVGWVMFNLFMEEFGNATLNMEFSVKPLATTLPIPPDFFAQITQLPMHSVRLKGLPRHHSPTLKKVRASVFVLDGVPFHQASYLHLRRSRLHIQLLSAKSKHKKYPLFAGYCVFPIDDILTLKKDHTSDFAYDILDLAGAVVVGELRGKAYWSDLPRLVQMHGGVYNSSSGIAGGSVVPFAVKPRVQGYEAKLHAEDEAAEGKAGIETGEGENAHYESLVVGGSGGEFNPYLTGDGRGGGGRAPGVRQVATPRTTTTREPLNPASEFQPLEQSLSIAKVSAPESKHQGAGAEDEESSDDSTSWEVPLQELTELPPDWTKAYDDRGQVYYVNRKTHRHQYTHPALATNGSMRQITPVMIHEEEEDEEDLDSSKDVRPALRPHMLKDTKKSSSYFEFTQFAVPKDLALLAADVEGLDVAADEWSEEEPAEQSSSSDDDSVSSGRPRGISRDAIAVAAERAMMSLRSLNGDDVHDEVGNHSEEDEQAVPVASLDRWDRLVRERTMGEAEHLELRKSGEEGDSREMLPPFTKERELTKSRTHSYAPPLDTTATSSPQEGSGAAITVADESGAEFLLPSLPPPTTSLLAPLPPPTTAAVTSPSVSPAPPARSTSFLHRSPPPSISVASSDSPASTSEVFDAIAHVPVPVFSSGSGFDSPPPSPSDSDEPPSPFSSPSPSPSPPVSHSRNSLPSLNPPSPTAAINSAITSPSEPPSQSPSGVKFTPPIEVLTPVPISGATVPEAYNSDGPFSIVCVGFSGVGRTAYAQHILHGSHVRSRYSKEDEERTPVFGFEYGGVDFPIQIVNPKVSLSQKLSDIPSVGTAHALVVMFDITDNDSFSQMIEWWKASRPREMPTILLGSHADLKEQQQVPQKSLNKFAAGFPDVAQFMVSATTGFNIAASANYIVSRMIETQRAYFDTLLQQADTAPARPILRLSNSSSNDGEAFSTMVVRDDVDILGSEYSEATGKALSSHGRDKSSNLVDMFTPPSQV